MQKKLIALAVAGLVSGAAFAQVAPNNVTMSGIVDMGYQYSSDSWVDDTPSQSAFNDGGHDGSRLKFSGTEDLGNGLKVGFNLDFRFKTDIHTASIATDNQNLWLGGNWGTVTAGTFGTAPDDINGYSEAGGMAWGNGVVGMFNSSGYHSNAVKYNSPNFNGLDFMVAYSTNNDGNADQTGRVGEENQRAFSGRVSYVAGPVKAGLAMIRDKMQDEGSRRTEWLLSGSYNFGPVILGAGYARSSYSDGALATAAGMDRRRAYRIDIGAPIGANDSVALSYSRAKWDLLTDDSEKASGWGLSYSHKMSKRTNLYASYGQVSQDEDNAKKVAITGDDYQKAFKVGVRHQF